MDYPQKTQRMDMDYPQKTQRMDMDYPQKKKFTMGISLHLHSLEKNK